VEPDRDLERLFLEARAEDERRVPSFAQVVRARPVRTRSPRYRWALALAMVVLVAAGVWRLTAAPNAPRMVISFAPGEMRVPTDYLLDMVPYPRAGEIPRIGASDWFPLPLATDASPDARRFP
jgi:hypothetical protein